MTLARERAAGRPLVLVASPFEEALVEQAQAVAGDRAEIVHRPDLLPPMRYAADHDGEQGWARTPERQAEWDALLASADALLGLPREAETAGSLEAVCPRVRWVQGTSAGMGQTVRRLGMDGTDVIVTTASGVHAGPLAEFVFAVLLGRAKRLDDLATWQAERRWQRFTGDELAGKTLAIVGPGRIGSRIARVARAFDMQVWALGRRYDPAREAELGLDRLFPAEGLHEMLAGADFVVLIAPHTGETEELIGRAEIAAMRTGATLINIGRGAVVDEVAMLDALRSGHIGFAALDVFREEPLPVDSPLWALPNVLISPHCSANAPTENARITEILVHNLDRFLDGRLDEMTPVLDKRRLY